MIKCLTIIQIELEFGNVGFWGEGKTGVPGEKPLGASKNENQQQTQPTYDAESGNRTRATLVGGLRGRFNHCAIPAPHDIFVQCSTIYRALEKNINYLSKTENSVSPTFLPQYVTRCVKWQTIATKTIAPSISFKMFLTPDVSTTIISATANVSKPFNSATKKKKQGPKQSAPLTLWHLGMSPASLPSFQQG